MICPEITTSQAYTFRYHIHISPSPALTLLRSLPKMAIHITPPEMNTTNQHEPLNLFRAIATDIHFWIPLCVLVAGLVLLDKLS